MSLNSPRFNTIVNVKNFGHDMTNEKLNEMFAKFGTVKSCKIMNEHCDESRRFAYVAFEDPDAAEDAIIELNGQKISEDLDSQRLRVQRTHKKYASQAKSWPKRQIELTNEEKPKDPNNDGKSIFVQGLDDTIDTEGLRRVFGRFGTISSTRIIMENGHSKGYGFVTFSTPEEAANAVKEKNGRFLASKILHVALARGKDPNKDSLFPFRQHQPALRFYVNPFATMRSREERQRNEELINRARELTERMRLHF